MYLGPLGADILIVPGISLQLAFAMNLAELGIHGFALVVCIVAAPWLLRTARERLNYDDPGLPGPVRAWRNGIEHRAGWNWFIAFMCDLIAIFVLAGVIFGNWPPLVTIP